ncbi:MAG: 7-cyano-7-deazaguanine synthase [Gemmataceae bacterium]|nr:7-cyano-7-deazaguanine synthase [Gemmataceae bacterium]
MSFAVLISGGLDSAILLGDALSREASVFPLYIRCGLAWEAVEEEYLRRYLDALARPALRPLTVLQQPVADLYGRHWSLSGSGVPDAATPDEAVFLPGRNLLLLGKALLWCHLNDVAKIALGTLASNPFPDATPAFFSLMQAVANQAVAGKVHIVLPFAAMKKTQVMWLGKDLPLEHTFSCIEPRGKRHCGQCNKCAERRQAFLDAGMTDPTAYAL